MYWIMPENEFTSCKGKKLLLMVGKLQAGATAAKVATLVRSLRFGP
jgi:hypothetical protein